LVSCDADEESIEATDTADSKVSVAPDEIVGGSASLTYLRVSPLCMGLDFSKSAKAAEMDPFASASAKASNLSLSELLLLISAAFSLLDDAPAKSTDAGGPFG
jgi:hypothetical protein